MYLKNSSKFKNIFEVIKNRRTIRDFKFIPVPSDDIIKILDAARYAPSAGNVQPWKFVVIKNRARLDTLRDILLKSWQERLKTEPGLDDKKRKYYIQSGRAAIRQVLTAPVYIFVFVDISVYPDYAVYEACLAVENLMLAARALGYGTGFFTTYFPEEVIKPFVNAPNNLKFICAVPVGAPKELPNPPKKKRLDEFIVYEKFQKKR